MAATVDADSSEASKSEGTTQRFGPFRRELRAFLELMAISGLALAQPAFDILQKNAELFVTRDTSLVQLIGLALVIVLGAPLAAWAVEVLVGLAFPAARRYAHAVLVGVGVLVLAVETIKRSTELGPVALELIGVGLALLGAYLVFRFDVVRLYLRVLAIAPVVFALIFVFASPVSDVVLRGQQASAATTTIAKPRRVVMIVFDEFPTESLLDGTGHIDKQLFPHFAELAAASTWYRNDSTVAPYTLQAVPAIMSGGYPRDPSVEPTASEYPHSIFTLLGGQYSENVHESITHVCPTSICSNAGDASGDAGLGGLLHDTSKLWSQFASPHREQGQSQLFVGHTEVDFQAWDHAEQFVQSLKRTHANHLDFLHVLLPHEPWHFTSTGQDNTQVGVAPGAPFLDWVNQSVADSARERHLLQVQAADTVLGQVIAKLKRLGQWKDSVVVVTTDHGVAFTENQPTRGVSKGNEDQIVWTPLFIKAPGQTVGGPDDRPAHSIDILPTVAGMIGAKLPWKVDGRSLLLPPQPEAPRRVFEWNLNTEHPKPPSKFLTIDGPTNFAKVLKARASSVPATERDRIYRVGPFGSLIGERADKFVDQSQKGPEGALDAPAVFLGVDPKAAIAPWLFVTGTIGRTGSEQPVAVAVNGTIAGVMYTYTKVSNSPDTQFFGPLLPSVFRKGDNSVQTYEIKGTPSAPQLVAVQGAGV